LAQHLNAISTVSLLIVAPTKNKPPCDEQTGKYIDSPLAPATALFFALDFLTTLSRSASPVFGYLPSKANFFCCSHNKMVENSECFSLAKTFIAVFESIAHNKASAQRKAPSLQRNAHFEITKI